jgi:hypothetical protein
MTLTLEDDVAALLREEIQRSGVPFKTAVNHFLRLGLRQSAPLPEKRFVVEPFSLRVPPDLQFDCVGELLEQLEESEHR